MLKKRGDDGVVVTLPSLQVWRGQQQQQLAFEEREELGV